MLLDILALHFIILIVYHSLFELISSFKKRFFVFCVDFLKIMNVSCDSAQQFFTFSIDILQLFNLLLHVRDYFWVVQSKLNCFVIKINAILYELFFARFRIHILRLAFLFFYVLKLLCFNRIDIECIM